MITTGKNFFMKLLYLALRNIIRRWTMPVKDWHVTLILFAIIFEDKVPALLP